MAGPTSNDANRLRAPGAEGLTAVVLSKKQAAVVVVVVAAGAGVVRATPATANPDIDTVQQNVDALFQEAEQASERYNDAKIRLAELRTDLGLMKGDAKAQKKQLNRLRSQLRDSMLDEFQASGSLGDFGQLVTSTDPAGFLADLGTQSSYDDLGASLYEEFATQADALSLRLGATKTKAAQVATLKDQLAEDEATIQAKYTEASALLDDLEAEEREALLSRSEVRAPAPASVPVSGRASAAVNFALAQVGKAYVYGAAGPSAFDCSGLTMRAWGMAGVGLPHSSAAQFSSGQRVAESDLRPGDLVFYYSPISHVSIYIGNGMAVDAGNPGSGVRVSPLHMMPYVGAVRPG